MDEISVEINAVSTAMKKCQTIQTELKSESTKMLQQYDSLGSGWNDDKYRELGQIVHKCAAALKQPLSELQRCEVFLQQLYKIIAEYESIHFEYQSSQRQSSNNVSRSSFSLGFNGNHSIFANIFNRNKDIHKALKGVEHRPIKLASEERSERQIISSISGDDRTEGSCSSLALAYAGNRAGYVVYDFRDGQSRVVFSLRSSIEQIANMEGVQSIILRGTSDIDCAEQLLSNMEPGREYYMGTGEHAAIVRLNNEGHYQYLELQGANPSDNGWFSLTQRELYQRFRCEDYHRTEESNYLIELDSLQSNAEFLNLLGYINTDE